MSYPQDAPTIQGSSTLRDGHLPAEGPEALPDDHPRYGLHDPEEGEVVAGSISNPMGDTSASSDSQSSWASGNQQDVIDLSVSISFGGPPD